MENTDATTSGISKSGLEGGGEADSSVRWLYAMLASDCFVTTIHLARNQGNRSLAMQGESELRQVQLKYSEQARAGILLAYFGDAKQVALELLTELYGDCDIKAILATVRAHIEAAESLGSAKLVQDCKQRLSRWAEAPQSTLAEIQATEGC